MSRCIFSLKQNNPPIIITMKLVKRTMLILALLSAVMPLLPAMGQEVYDKFYDAIHEGDTVAMKEYMGQIRALNEQTAERYVAEYNYYYNKSKLFSGVFTSAEPPAKDELVQGEVYSFVDSTGALAGYMYFVERYDFQLVDSALDVISRGIARYPDRLDMRYGKIHFLQQLCRWDDFSNEILAALKHSSEIHHQWIYPNSTSTGEEMITEAVFDYEKELFNAAQNAENTDEVSHKIELLRSIALQLYQQFPRYVENLNVVSITYQMVGEYSNALTWLLKAEKVSPKDGVILSNIADTYYFLGDKKNERKYLKKVVKYGNEEERERAKRFLEE